MIGGIGLAGAVDAGEPARQACIGDLFNKADQAFPELTVGEVVSDFARQPGTFGGAINFIQSGQLPDSVFPNPCNPDGQEPPPTSP